MSPSHAGSLLIVDDDLGVAVLQRRRLERAGYSVNSAATTDEARQIIKLGDIELLILDYRLNRDVTGLEFFEQLKEAGHVLPVIMVTGFSEELVVVQALRAGVRDFISKSSEYLDHLPEIVRRVLRQVRTERQLAESEARLNSVISSAMDAIITVDEHQRITLFNAAAERMFGGAASDAIGAPIQMFIPDGPSGTEMVPLGLPIHSGAEDVTTVRQSIHLGRRRDGGEFPLELSSSAAHYNGYRFHTLIVRDITERCRAEDRIRQQADLLDRATDAILVIDADNRIHYWNHGAHRLYGWTEREALGRDPIDFLLRGPEAPVVAARTEVLEKGEWSGELCQRTKDGREIVVESRWTLVRDDRGRPTARLVINTDVTEKRRMEAQNLRAQRMDSLGTLAGGIAHDLNNVLTPILMGVELLKRPMSEERRHGLLETLHATAQRGADLVRQILSFARGAEGKRTPLQLTSILRETQKLLDHSLPKSIDVVVAMADGLWPIIGDGTQVSQVLMNLCVNACDAMPDGGRLTITAENAALDEHYVRQHPRARKGPYVLLQVADTGTGIPADIVDKIFDPFFTTKEQGKGTGLGLATVLGIVKGHDGLVNVYSHPGQGTRFAVFFPARLTEDARRAMQEPETPPGRGELILVVDDEASIRAVTCAILEGNGYRTLAAGHGAEALELHAQQAGAIDLVLLDMMMPTLDGPKTMQALLQRQPGLRIVATSGLPAGGTHEGPGLGELAFLTKPYTSRKLLEVIGRLLVG